jgi:UDP-N-acetylmuramyl pentapeptide phosphotransferase/UDP-N-acetylglucosamine-1-phosphate transferase
MTVAGAFALAVVMGWLSIGFGHRVGFVDLPDDDLKIHTGTPVPLGGLALLVSVHVSLAVAGSLDWGLLAASVALFVIGLVDDAVSLSPSARLVGTIMAGLLFALLSDVVVAFWPTVAAAFLVLLLVNAINLIDGLDMLAGSTTAVAAAGLALYASVLGVSEPLLPLIVSAALLGFLVWNRPPARLYLGDNGAYLVGLFLAWSILRAGSNWTTGLLGAALIGMPLLDLGATVIRRASNGSALFAGDRDHTYDHLKRAGFSTWRIAVLYTLAQALWVMLLIGVASWTTQIVALSIAIILGGVLAIRAGLSR